MLFVGQLPSVGNDADDGDKERDEEEEKLRREAIKEAEEKRRVKHKKMEEERETLRQGIRDKVKRTFAWNTRNTKTKCLALVPKHLQFKSNIVLIFKYKIEKTDDSDEDEEEDFGAPAIQENLEDDSIARNYNFSMIYNFWD